MNKLKTSFSITLLLTLASCQKLDEFDLKPDTCQLTKLSVELDEEQQSLAGYYRNTEYFYNSEGLPEKVHSYSLFGELLFVTRYEYDSGLLEKEIKYDGAEDSQNIISVVEYQYEQELLKQRESNTLKTVNGESKREFQLSYFRYENNIQVGSTSFSAGYSDLEFGSYNDSDLVLTHEIDYQWIPETNQLVEIWVDYVYSSDSSLIDTTKYWGETTKDFDGLFNPSSLNRLLAKSSGQPWLGFNTLSSRTKNSRGYTIWEYSYDQNYFPIEMKRTDYFRGESGPIIRYFYNYDCD